MYSRFVSNLEFKNNYFGTFDDYVCMTLTQTCCEQEMYVDLGLLSQDTLSQSPCEQVKLSCQRQWYSE